MFACFYASDFPVQAIVRAEPEHSQCAFHSTPIAVLDGPASLQRVFAVNEPARAAGIEIGMTRIQLEAGERVILRKRAPALEESAQAALLDCAHEFSPRVEGTLPGAVIADLSGTEKLFGSAQKVANRIVARGEEFGFDLHVGIAANPDTALHLARGYRGISIVETGEEAARLAPLQLDVLTPREEILEILDAWGIRNCKALAMLPPTPLVERLGQEGLRLQKLAKGETKRTLVPVEPAMEFRESFEFEDPVETIESISFILNRLLQQLCGRLIARSLATNELRLVMQLDARQISDPQKGSELYQRAWKLPIATQNPKALFKLIHLDLEATPQTAPICALTLEAEPVKQRFTQNGFFVPAGPEPEKLELTLARIRGLVGEADANGIARTGSAKLLDSHQSDSLEVVPFSPQALPEESENKFRPQLALRIFRPALNTSVELKAEKPASLLFRKRRVPVLAASGPWRSSGQWWTESSAWARDEWDVALKTIEGIGFYRIYLDLISSRWFIEGMFD